MQREEKQETKVPDREGKTRPREPSYVFSWEKMERRKKERARAQAKTPGERFKMTDKNKTRNSGGGAISVKTPELHRRKTSERKARKGENDRADVKPLRMRGGLQQWE